jgi:hypothetical protein
MSFREHSGSFSPRHYTRLSFSICFLCCLTLLAFPGFAQRAAELAGAITDTSGAAVPAVTVTAANTQTGVTLSTTTNDSGLYRFDELVVGSYRIEASKPGFKTQSTSVVLEGARTTTINIQMEVGAVSTTVEVAAVAPMLDTESQTVSDNVETKLMENVPTALRRPLQLVQLAATVSYSGTEPTTTETPFFSVAGGFTQPSAYFDGANATNTRVESSVLTMNPSIESTAEFRLVETSYKAEYGGSGTGLVLATTKSGTNQFHGAGWDFLRNQDLDARNFFADSKPLDQENIFGGAVGGPIIKNKLFFFADYEGTRNTIGTLTGNGRGLTAQFFETLPTDLQRQGNFSQTYNADGTLQTIYDPMSTVVGSSGTVTRTPFPGNIIPSSRISPIALSVLNYEPQPNTAPIDITGTDNFVSTKAAESVHRNSIVSKEDYDRGEKDRFFYRLMWDNAPWDYIGAWPGNSLGSQIVGASGNLSQRNPFDPSDLMVFVYSRMQLGGWTHIFTPTLINDVRFGYNVRSWGAQHSSSGLGIPAMLCQGITNCGLTEPAPIDPTTIKFGKPNNAIPNFLAGQYTLPGNGWLGSGDYQLPMRDWNLIESLNWIKGSHQFKFGYETRRSAGTTYSGLNWPGTYNFVSQGTAANPTSTETGNAMASFLAAWPDSGSYKYVSLRHFWSWWHSFYAQDDWKVNSKLTVNLGLRWEFDTPMREGLEKSRCTIPAPYNWNGCQSRIIGIDLTETNPVSGTPGVITFPTTYTNYDFKNFMPRLGFAYNVARNTVIRGGGGTFYSYPWQSGLRNAPGDVRPDVATVGDFASSNNDLTAPFTMASGMPAPAPFNPSQLNAGFGAAAPGQATFLSPYVIDRNLKTPYSIEYDLNVQHQWGNGLFLEVGGVATMGRHIFVQGIDLEQIPIQQVQAIAAATGAPPTLADRPYPQFTDLTYGSWPFSSHYVALVVKAEKRYSNGLSFLSSYSLSKWLTDLSYQNYYDISAGNGPAAGEKTHNFVFSSTYELPWGVGRKYLTHGPLTYLLGGWNVSPILSVQSGDFETPTAASNTAYDYGSQWANVVPGCNVNGGPKTITQWFNTSCFAAPANYTLGNSGEGVIVGPGLVNLDLSLAKDFNFTERYKLTFRGEFFNSLNHVNWGDPITSIPTTNPATGEFVSPTGYINSARTPRQIQLGLRFAF